MLKVILLSKFIGDNMRYLFLIIISFFIVNGCDTNENDYAEVKPFGAHKIESIHINGNQVKVTTSYGTPTPCWYYFKTESQNFRDTFISKVCSSYWFIQSRRNCSFFWKWQQNFKILAK
jgi:hypothetical protein